MKEAQPKTIHLKDYQPPAYIIDETHLTVQIFDGYSDVQARLHLRRNLESTASVNTPLVLDGQHMELLGIVLDGKALTQQQYLVDAHHLTLASVPDRFELQITSRIKPEQNTALEGLYKSGSMYCTQCEAEGFRRISYYLDRPDVMSLFTTRIEADKGLYPTLLSNGNLVDSGDLEQGRHYAVWEDPFRKPCYLFAMVAGDLKGITDEFVTQSGRKVALKILVEPHNIDKCDFAMASLKRAMKWDEEVYGREYDLDVFHIVAVDDFNMGAMENKSLNIFNSSCVLARPEMTTDSTFERIDSIVAHEYFHNWSGNRVTCRDWFQLSLKEGFTVFRDAQYTEDTYSKAVKRIDDAMVMRTMQFAEDAGPMAHPIRPDSFIEISNFYTLTVYEKGAEVVRMVRNILGPEAFRKGADLYFERHDGQAVTTEDFVKAMEDASGVDLNLFSRWYHQAGTPELHIDDEYDAKQKLYRLTVRQSCPATPGQPTKEPFHIPLSIGLLDQQGNDIPLKPGPKSQQAFTCATQVLNVTQTSEVFEFIEVPEKPLPSLLRNFSAPVKVYYDYDDQALIRLMASDSDGFNRWDATQRLGVKLLLQMAKQQRIDAVLPGYLNALKAILADSTLDGASKSYMLALPSLSYVLNAVEVFDVIPVSAARLSLQKQIAEALEQEMLEVFLALNVEQVYESTHKQMAERALKGILLRYLTKVEGSQSVAYAEALFGKANNMTDQMLALQALMDGYQPQVAETAIQAFYQQWQNEDLVVLEWFKQQAFHPTLGTLDRVRELLEHPKFDLKNPNKVRSVIGAYANNMAQFHREDGAGYAFLADKVLELDAMNPQIASRLVAPLTQVHKYPVALSKKMLVQLKRIEQRGNLSPDLYEVVSKALSFASQ
jgi:aminopeptidase N